MNRREYEPGLCPSRGFDLTGAPLEFAIGAAGDREKMIEPGEELMFALVPALGALLEDVVVVIFSFFDQPLQADVPAYFIAMLVKRQQREQAGDAAIAVTERVDAEEIEHECADGHEGRDAVLIDGVPIDETEFIHGGWRGFGGDTFETYDGRGAWPQFDDFVVHFLEPTSIATAFLREPMQAAQQIGSDGQCLPFGVDEMQGSAIPGDVLLGPVFGAGMAEHERAQPVWRDGDAFDAIGRFDALDHGHFAQGLQHLRRLSGIQLLLALGFGKVVEQPIRAHRYGEVTKAMVSEGHHGRRLYSVKLTASAAKLFCPYGEGGKSG